MYKARMNAYTHTHTHTHTIATYTYFFKFSDVKVHVRPISAPQIIQIFCGINLSKHHRVIETTKHIKISFKYKTPWPQVEYIYMQSYYSGEFLGKDQWV